MEGSDGERCAGTKKAVKTAFSISVSILCLSNDCAIRDDGVFWDDDDAITREPAFVIGIFAVGERTDGDVITNAGVFVDDGAFDAAIGADADVWTG